jgi:hypothetical protein
MINTKRLIYLCLFCSTFSVVNVSRAESRIFGCSMEVSRIVGLGFDSGSKVFIESDSDTMFSDLKKYFANSGNQNELYASTVVGGTVVSTVGLVASYSISYSLVTSATVVGAGTAFGATTGAIFGTGVGLASGGTAIAATVPFAKAGALLGGSIAGNVVSYFGIGATAPGWAVPLAIGGVTIVAIGGSLLIYNHNQDDDNSIATANLLCVE